MNFCLSLYLSSTTLLSADASHTAPPPIRPIVIPPPGWSTSLCGLANALSGNNHLLLTQLRMHNE